MASDADRPETFQVWRSSVTGFVGGVGMAAGWMVGIPAIGLFHKPGPSLTAAIVGTTLCFLVGCFCLYLTVVPMLALSDKSLKVRNLGRARTVRLVDIAEVSISQLGLTARLEDGSRLTALIAGGLYGSRSAQIKAALDSSVAARRSQEPRTADQG